MTIRHLYPAVEPSLNLDFANSKKLDSRITFTRGSTATYTDESGIIRTAAANEARFDHDGDGNSLGLLIEESRTNLRPYSNPIPSQFNSLSSPKTTIAPSSTIAPDGTATALVHTCQVTGNTTEYFLSYAAIPTTGKIVVSVFIKNVSAQNVRLSGDPSNQGYYGGIASTIDFTGSVPTISKNTGVGTDPLIECGLIPYPNGWYKAYQVIDLSISSVTPPNGQTRASVPTFVNGSSGEQFLSWGYSIEAGSFPTSYIPTSGSTVTRSADAASMTGTNFSSWYNSSEGTVFAKFKSQYPDGEPTTIFTGQITNTIRIFVFTNLNRALLQYGSTGVYSNDGASGYPTESDFSSAALFYTDDGASSSFGGSYQGFPVKSGTGTGGVTISSFIFAPFTGASGALQASSAHLSRFTYYPVRLSDGTLQALTL